MNIVVNSQIINESKKLINDTESLLNVRINFEFKNSELIYSVCSQSIL